MRKSIENFETFAWVDFELFFMRRLLSWKFATVEKKNDFSKIFPQIILPQRIVSRNCLNPTLFIFKPTRTSSDNVKSFQILNKYLTKYLRPKRDFKVFAVEYQTVKSAENQGQLKTSRVKPSEKQKHKIHLHVINWRGKSRWYFSAFSCFAFFSLVAPALHLEQMKEEKPEKLRCLSFGDNFQTIHKNWINIIKAISECDGGARDIHGDDIYRIIRRQTLDIIRVCYSNVSNKK